ncbi:fungal hydrophobin-domain-containing protein [Fomitopsis betulina]|nr:fungal hydrophobin-domain-containing protein [Fomitopsis betulina]
MHFKLAVSAALLSAFAAHAVPVPCPPSDTSTSVWVAPTSTTSDWSAPTTTSDWPAPSSSWSAPAPTSTYTTPDWPTPTVTVTTTVSPPEPSQGSATPTPTTTSAPEPSQGSGGGQCNTGPVVCCNSVESPGGLSSSTKGILGLLGISVGDILDDVGLGCSSLVGGASCSANTLCCENNNFNGLINIGCVPINISL